MKHSACQPICLYKHTLALIQAHVPTHMHAHTMQYTIQHCKDNEPFKQERRGGMAHATQIQGQSAKGWVGVQQHLMVQPSPGHYSAVLGLTGWPCGQSRFLACFTLKPVFSKSIKNHSRSIFPVFLVDKRCNFILELLQKENTQRGMCATNSEDMPRTAECRGGSKPF